MHFTLIEAAERAKMPSEELIRCIERDELTAERSSEDAQYRISAEALEAFLSKKSFETFWNNTDEADNEAFETKSSAQSGNLRRVLTAEAVAELKIEHQVLMSRVETLERLFSEFMDLEKIEKTLVLEESWKIESAVAHENAVPLALNQAPIGAQNEDSAVSSDAMVIKDPWDNASAEEVKEAKVAKYDDAKITDVEETQTRDGLTYRQTDKEKTSKIDKSQHVAKKDETKPKITGGKPKSAKDLLTKKLTEASKDIPVSEKRPARDIYKENIQTATEVDSPISVRLAEYERRLAEAKQTATQIWH